MQKRTITRKLINLIKNLLGTGLVTVALILLLSPEFVDLSTRSEAKKIRESMAAMSAMGDDATEDLRNGAENNELSGNIPNDLEDTETQDSKLKAILKYNVSLQSGIQKDAISFSVRTDAWDKSEVFGTIRIPSIDVDMPLYIGSSDENLAAGAAVLEGTSLPVGGTGTNSVISGHRGWKGAAYFKEIESVSWGDEDIITNPWETLTYHVIDIAVIAPNCVEPLLIQEGLDMITLVTCHPYRAPRNMRYVLFAIREESPAESVTTLTYLNNVHESIESAERYSEAQEAVLSSYGSSSKEIRMENWLRRGSAVCCILLLLIMADRRLKQVCRRK